MKTWRSLRLDLTAALSLGAAISAGQAVTHLWLTAQRGVICGLEPGHCWACYEAPILALAALAVWRMPQPAGAGR